MEKLANYSVSHKVPILCKYHADNSCQYGDNCHYLHGLECPHCGRNVLHPLDSSIQRQHLEDCRQFYHSSEEFLNSQSQECGICLDYPRKSGKYFGLLENCDHVFCLECIRQWRQHSIDFGQVVRFCPLCRTPSFFVIPSLVVPGDVQRKNEIIERELVHFQPAVSMHIVIQMEHRFKEISLEDI
ncbi:E3 ubiquitin-protein ligase makorin-1 [Galdieria sulphuraria]|nr:E3 ubiquitin-protein ligase makorin-1 [Galdieria sulphuraria]